MLEWLIELERDWTWKPGAYGRGIEHELPPDVAEALGYAYPRSADDAVTAYIDRLE